MTLTVIKDGLVIAAKPKSIIFWVVSNSREPNPYICAVNNHLVIEVSTEKCLKGRKRVTIEMGSIVVQGKSVKVVSYIELLNQVSVHSVFSKCERRVAPSRVSNVDMLAIGGHATTFLVSRKLF